MLGSERATAYCSGVVADLDDYSIDLNRALSKLSPLAQNPKGETFQRALHQFLIEHGHRSFSLDLIRPNFAADPSQVLALLGCQVPRQPGSPADAATRRRVDPENDVAVLPLRPFAGSEAGREVGARVLAPLAGLTRRSVRLRENQRLTWQRGLAVLRRLYLLAGQDLVRQGALLRPEDIFFLTVEEVHEAANTPAPNLKARVAERAREYAENCERTSYPRFLKGDQPWDDDEIALAEQFDHGSELRGEPVSPGTGRGKARVILHPDDLDRIEPGDILVTRGADPGWTPVFDRLAALVMETGGQLSHASVVAREYRLPAVVGIDGATAIIQNGEDLFVDGSLGVVRRGRTANSPSPSKMERGRR